MSLIYKLTHNSRFIRFTTIILGIKSSKYGRAINKLTKIIHVMFNEGFSKSLNNLLSLSFNTRQGKKKVKIIMYLYTKPFIDYTSAQNSILKTYEELFSSKETNNNHDLRRVCKRKKFTSNLRN